MYAFTICLLSAAIAFFAFKAAQKKPQNYPPGPRGLPLVGNLFQVKRLMSGNESVLLDFKSKYNDLCMMWVGSRPILFVNNRYVAKELLNDRSAIYSSRPRRSKFRNQVWPWRLMAEPAGAEYRSIKKLYQAYLGTTQSLQFRPYQDYESRIMMKTLLKEPQSFMNAVEKYTVSVTFSVVHGCRLDTLKHPILVEFMNLWDNVMKYIQPGTLLIDYLPVLYNLPLYFQPRVAKVMALVKREMQLHLAFLYHIQAAVKVDEAPRCFSTDLAKVQEEQGVSDDKATHILSMLVGAGSDTTASMLQTSFKVMAMNPEAVKKAQAELDRVIGPSRLPTWEDEASLPAVRAFIKETHRWAPVGTFSVPHCATRDDVYRGYFIPKGTTVFPNLAGMNHDEDRYKDHHIFDPSRFEGDDLSAFASTQQQDVDKRDHVHYGFGRRMCPGIYVAEASLFINISRILWGFDVTPIPGQKLDMSDRFQSIIWKPNPFKVDIQCRGAAYEQTLREALTDVSTDASNFDDVMSYVPAK